VPVSVMAAVPAAVLGSDRDAGPRHPDSAGEVCAEAVAGDRG
jgi:hypothetical protein